MNRAWWVRNGVVFLDGAFVRTDVHIRQGKIVAIGTDLQAEDETPVDCQGRYVCWRTAWPRLCRRR